MHRNSSIHPKRVVLAVLVLLSLALVPSSSEAVTRYQQTNLVSDISGLAAVTDANLKNPWGIASSPTSPFWVSNNATGVATLYNSSGTPQSLVVTIPPSSSRPTGQVFNGSSNFLLTPGNPARFLFATENGTISGWNPGANPTIAILEVDNSASGAIYKGLAIGNNGSGDFLYAANFNGSIDVFDSNFAPATLSGSFADPNLPSGYAPFNIQKIGDELYVTYAVSNGAGDDVPGPGNGIVSVFDLNGNLARRLTTGGVLNSPWGLALAPSSFGDVRR